MSFDDRMRMLHLLGVDFNRETTYRGEGEHRHQIELDRFEVVYLPLTDTEWCNLCMTERSEYMGGCCGLMSAVQDTVNCWFRFDSGWVRCVELSEVAEMFVNHGDHMWESFEAAQKEALTDYKSLDDYAGFATLHWDRFAAWDKIHLIWLLVKDHFAPERPTAFASHLSEWDKSTNVIVKACRTIAWDRVMGRTDEDDARYVLMLARMLPAMKTLWEGLQAQKDRVQFDGYGIFDGEEITYNGLGMCVYPTRAGAVEILDRLRDREEDHGRSLRDLEIWPVRITVEGGLVVKKTEMA